MPPRASPPSHSDKWHAVVNRDASQSTEFVYAVKSTGIYCRAGCPSKTPKPDNVEFFDTPSFAENAGYRACKRCRPSAHDESAAIVKKITSACEQIRSQEEEPNLEHLAKDSDMSVAHFQKTFKSVVGVSPKAYALAVKMDKARETLSSGKTSITTAIYEAGFNSSSRFYETATKALGMKPSDYKKGGAGQRILFAIGECSLGSVLVACSKIGVCAILLGDEPEQLLQDLQDRFPNAELLGGDTAFEGLVAQVVGFIDNREAKFELPLDIQGTAFQERVWRALCLIPAGTTATYAEIAQAIGAPNSHRAVAQACGANKIAIAIPCHRVVRSDGSLSGYRWGIERKRSLLTAEDAA